MDRGEGGHELGFGSGMTCWRRLAAWNEAGVWEKLHLVLLKKPRSAKQLDWSRAVIGSSHVRAARRGPKAVPARSTVHGRAASTTSLSTGRASRSLTEGRQWLVSDLDRTEARPRVTEIVSGPRVRLQPGRSTR
ncbi:hypothetical protein [Streptomyces sp. B3I8]|uniref:hypothetical protein n=1 Tax=Streptomyces sp. B3I8 TaxID=3042303 RepID=UPI0027811E4C|nr:transposase [Streptomyces sp. B3I8]